MISPFQLDGPADNTGITVTTVAQEVKVGALIPVERKAVIIQPLDDDIFWGYSSGVTSTTGFKIFKNTLMIIQSGPDLPIFVVAASGSIDTRIGEVS